MRRIGSRRAAIACGRKPSTPSPARPAPQTRSYLVTNIVSVETSRVNAVGALLDAALEAGANEVRGVSFSVARPDSARRAALALAVTQARGDAEVAARAAGGRLGALLELVASELGMPGPRPMFSARAVAAESTPIEVGEETIQAAVTVRWRYIAPGGP